MTKATLKIDIWTRGRRRLPARDTADLAELFAPHAAHVPRAIGQGYQAGEICDDRFSGWWTIDEAA